MDSNASENLNSMLSYVSGRDGRKPPSLFEKEVGSWLMMATELVPSALDMNSSLSNNAAQYRSAGNDDVRFESNIPFTDENNAVSPNHYAIPSPSFGVFGEGEVRKNSIDMLTLPSPALESINPSKASIMDLQQLAPLTNSTDHSTSWNNTDMLHLNNCLPLPDLDNVSLKRSINCRATEVEKRQKRLEKNREIAKNCRKRKKEKKEAIQEEIEELRQTNLELQSQLSKLHKDDHETENQKHEEYIIRLKKYVKEQDEKSITRENEAFYAAWSASGQERSITAQVLLEQLKMLLLPTQMTKMCLWSFEQDSIKGGEESTVVPYGSGIWNILSSVICLTEDQKRSIIQSRGSMLRQQENIASVLDIVDEVKEKVKSSMENMLLQLRGILDVLTPLQQAKFLIWMDEGMHGLSFVNQMKKLLESNLSFREDDANSISLSDESFSSLGHLD